MTQVSELLDRIGDIPVTTAERLVKAKSRDFFWYSPVLKEKLNHVTAEAVIAPRTEDEVAEVLAACYALDIPVTPRGGGTGNYAQAMPLAGGIVLDMTALNGIIEIGDGTVRVQPGALMGALQEELRERSGQELRMHPSTLETATIGGFLAGGSGGVGSIHWGMLREPGNVLGLRLLTLEAEPRRLDLVGVDVETVLHSYGCNGVITEIEMAVAPVQKWVEMIFTFNDWMATLKGGWHLAHHQGLLLKELGAVEAPAPYAYFNRYRKFLSEEAHVLCVIAAPNAVGPVVRELSSAGGTVAYRSDTASAEEKKGLPHLHHLTWNHTTFRALKTDAQMTYLQVGTPAGDPLAALEKIASNYAGEIIGHVEFTRTGSRVYASFLPMYRYTSKPRLDQVVEELEAMGCVCYNPHAYTYEEGNNSGPCPKRLALKRKADPKGLLNPGKMIGWDNPDYAYDPKGDYDYPGLMKAVQ